MTNSTLVAARQPLPSVGTRSRSAVPQRCATSMKSHRHAERADPRDGGGARLRSVGPRRRLRRRRPPSQRDARNLQDTAERLVLTPRAGRGRSHGAERGTSSPAHTPLAHRVDSSSPGLASPPTMAAPRPACTDRLESRPVSPGAPGRLRLVPGCSFLCMCS